MAAIELSPGIITDPEIMGGEAVIKGTRIPASLIVGQLAGGATFEELLDEYDLTREQIQAALGYAKQLVDPHPSTYYPHLGQRLPQ